MVKKQQKASQAATKKAKTIQKVERKETKKALKLNESGSKAKSSKLKRQKLDSDTDGADLEDILETMRREWEEAHMVTEELVEGPPSRRANATLTVCPNGNHLWCIGGEFFTEDGKAFFYNDVFRYTPDKQEWRKFVSPTCPGPRSAHAVVASPAGGGKLFLFGGEFSSLHQNSFHHYRDFWCFDIGTHVWDRIETKVRPGARSGHRMAVWKHLIILFGGFYDPGITTRYLNDLWIFDTQEYKWVQVELKDTDQKPSPRSGFSFLPCADGIVLHGGYCKEYLKGKRPMGVMLDDTWLLKITLPSDAPTSTPASNLRSTNKASAKLHSPYLKWEKRKRPSDAYAPPLRSGCTMALWTVKGVGVLFGGVTDEDTSEEGLESVFWNDMYSYQLGAKGRWNSLTLKKPKIKGAGKKMKQQQKDEVEEVNDEECDDKIDYGSGNKMEELRVLKLIEAERVTSNVAEDDDPLLTTPMPRYNAMLAILRNTLYIYGGIFERGSHEYTLDDFYSIQLEKMDRFLCLKKNVIAIPEEEESSSDDGDDEYTDGSTEEDSDDNKNETEEEEDDEHGGIMLATCSTRDVTSPEDPKLMKTAIGEDFRDQASTFMDISSTWSPDDVQSTPLPGETLAVFYARTREFWAQKAILSSDNKGKQLRREGFALAEERYVSYGPILEEVEKILADAGLDEDEMKRGAMGASLGAEALSRNRR